MKKKAISLLLVFCFLFLFSGCANKAQTGMAIGGGYGAAAGQIIGGNTEATLIGLVVGSFLGYVVGNEMDKVDMQKLNSVYESTPDRRTTKWKNPNTGNSYRVTPKKTYTKNRKHCRDAEILVTIDGKPKKIIQKACRDNRGIWHAQG